MTRVCLAIVLPCFMLGCVHPLRPSASTLRALDQQLDAARDAGIPTEVLYRRDSTLPRDAVAIGGSPDVTYVVVTAGGAEIRLATSSPLTAEEAEEIADRWSARFVRRGDLNGALKALVHGYLAGLREAGLVRSAGPVIPFLEPRIPGPRPKYTYGWGLPLGALVAFLSIWAGRRRPR